MMIRNAMILQAKITEKENNDFILNDLKESCEEGNIETQNDSAVLLYLGTLCLKSPKCAMILFTLMIKQ